MEQSLEYISLCDYLYHPPGEMRIFDFKQEYNRDAFTKSFGNHIKTLTEQYLQDDGK